MLSSKKYCIHKIALVLALFINLSILDGCRQKQAAFIFPNEKNFSLNSSVSKTSLKVGEELYVNGVFKNLTNSGYRLDSDASFSKSGLIHINKYTLKEEELITVGIERFVDIKPQQEVTEDAKLIMDKKGSFKVVVSSNFEISNPNSDEKRNYYIKAKEIIVEVK